MGDYPWQLTTGFVHSLWEFLSGILVDSGSIIGVPLLLLFPPSCALFIPVGSTSSCFLISYITDWLNCIDVFVSPEIDKHIYEE